MIPRIILVKVNPYMPAKNSIKIYRMNGIYHIFNRGIDKREIFLDDYDYSKFLNIIKIRLCTKAKDPDNPETIPEMLYGKIRLIAYCLMPNHFHLLIEQRSPRSMVRFMRSISTSYSLYYNSKYNKSGRVTQGVYKAVNVNSHEQLIRVGRYIHRNPTEVCKNIKQYKWSSYKPYIEGTFHSLLHKNSLLDHFNGNISDFITYTSKDDPF